MGLKLTEEQRAERSRRARELHSRVVDPETGRRAFGGPQPNSGRPRHRRAGEKVAAAAQENAGKIITALKDALDPEQPAAIRLQAGKTWLDIERQERELQLREERELHELSQEQLIAQIVEKLAKVTGSLPADMDLHSDEVPQDELEAASYDD